MYKIGQIWKIKNKESGNEEWYLALTDGDISDGLALLEIPEKIAKKELLENLKKYIHPNLVRKSLSGGECLHFPDGDSDLASEALRISILNDVRKFHSVKYGTKKEFKPGDRVSYAGRVFDAEEMVSLADSSLEFWLTTGRFAEKFEKDFAEFLGVKYSLLVNSGSSANLLALSSLTSDLFKERKICRGDEIITVAAGFPTTVAPAVQFGAVPVFVDVSLPQYNIDVTKLDEALSPKTKAVMVAHTLGNPFDLKTIREFCTKNNLWLIEDNCDALGSKYKIDGEWKYTGTIGDIGTSSFYPPHHMTMGEGGAVYMNSPKLKKSAESFRDWGRDCWCPSGKDNTCNKRFRWKLGELPEGYDHKYIYSHFGYNLKVTDMQAAIGCAQLNKLPEFIKKRRANWQVLRDGLRQFEDRLILPEPAPDSLPSWFGFLITLRDGIKIERKDFVEFLENSGIQTRMLFAGNLLRHPLFDEMRALGKGYRVIGNLTNTDTIMNRTFWLGVYPGLTDSMLGYMIDTISKFLKK